MLLVAVCAVSLIVRIRLLDASLEREGEHAYRARMALAGNPPWKLAYNMKLPGTDAIYELSFAMFGQIVTSIRLGLLIVNTATVLLIRVTREAPLRNARRPRCRLLLRSALLQPKSSRDRCPFQALRRIFCRNRNPRAIESRRQSGAAFWQRTVLRHRGSYEAARHRLCRLRRSLNGVSLLA